MPSEDWKVSDKASRMRNLVAAVAGPMLPTENRKRWIERAAQYAGVTYRQAKSVFYSEIKDPDHRAISAMKAAAGKYEAEQLAQRFDCLANSLNVRDADFHSSDVAALLHAARALRGLVGPGTD
jgi:hypothetical protein